MTQSLFSKCPDCGVEVPHSDEPNHKYLGCSSGCWKVFGEILAKEYSDRNYMSVHRLTVDAYTAQHPGKPEPRTIQSINVHLLGLYLVLEKDAPHEFATKAMAKVIESLKPNLQWLEPPASLGNVTVIDVVRAKDVNEHSEMVRKWAHAVWDSWQPHRESIIELARQVL